MYLKCDSQTAIKHFRVPKEKNGDPKWKKREKLMCKQGKILKLSVQFFIRAHFCKNTDEIRAIFCQKYGRKLQHHSTSSWRGSGISSLKGRSKWTTGKSRIHCSEQITWASVGSNPGFCYLFASTTGAYQFGFRVVSWAPGKAGKTLRPTLSQIQYCHQNRCCDPN